MSIHCEMSGLDLATSTGFKHGLALFWYYLEALNRSKRVKVIPRFGGWTVGLLVYLVF